MTHLIHRYGLKLVNAYSFDAYKNIALVFLGEVRYWLIWNLFAKIFYVVEDWFQQNIAGVWIIILILNGHILVFDHLFFPKPI